MRQSVWTSKKFAGKFSGHFERDSGGERIFVLKRREGGKPMRKVYESQEAAKAVGFKLVKPARVKKAK